MGDEDIRTESADIGSQSFIPRPVEEQRTVVPIVEDHLRSDQSAAFQSLVPPYLLYFIEGERGFLPP
jgi:hypothetical protein